MKQETQEKIVRIMKLSIPIIIIAILAIISVFINKNRRAYKEEKAPILEVTTEEAPMQFDEEVNSAALYLSNIEKSVTVKTSEFEYFTNCQSKIEGSKVRNTGSKKIINRALEGADHIDFFTGTYSIFGEHLENCLFRIIPEKKKAEINKYQYMGMEFQQVNMVVGSAGCDEVDIQYKKAMYIVNQKGMFYIHFEINDDDLKEQLGFHNIDITARLQPYKQETDDCVANIACFITKNGFEFYSDIPLYSITLDRDTDSLNTWQTISVSDVSEFVFNGSEFSVNGEVYENDWETYDENDTSIDIETPTETDATQTDATESDTKESQEETSEEE